MRLLNLLCFSLISFILLNDVNAQSFFSIKSNAQYLLDLSKVNYKTPGIMPARSPKPGSLPAYDGDFVKEFSFLFENDVFFDVDEDYTTGLALEWKTKYLNVPGFIGFKERPRANRNNEVIKNTITDNIRNTTTFSIGIFYFTRDSLGLETAGVYYKDRPYASFQYVSIGRISDRRKIHKDGINNSYTKFESELQLGLVGGPMARNLQSWIHDKVTGGPIPRGWENQIGGTNNRFAFNYKLQYEVLWFRSMIREKRLNPKRSVYGYNRYGLHQFFNSTAFIKGNIGNIKADTGLGLKINLFNINNTNEYSLNFFDPRQDDFPSGSPPVLRYPKEKYKDYVNYNFRNYKKPCENCNLFANYLNVEDLVKSLNIHQDYANNPDKFLKEEYIKKKIHYNNKIMDACIKKAKSLDAEITNLKTNGAKEKEIAEKEEQQLKYLDLFNYIRKRGNWMDHSGLLDPNPKYYKRKFEFNLFIEPEFRWIGYNGMLQGLLFNDDSPYTIPVINPFVFEIKSGINFQFDYFKMQIGYAGRSREFREELINNAPFPANYNSELEDGRLWHSWGYIRIAAIPNLIGDSYNRNWVVERKLKKARKRMKKAKRIAKRKGF